MVNKKGYIKTLEAVISIVGILLFTIGVTPREIPNPNEIPFVVQNAQDYIIEQLQLEPYRQKVLDMNFDAGGEVVVDDKFLDANDTITNLVQNNLPPSYSYEFKICSTTTCLAKNPPIGVSVYSDDVMLAGLNSAGEPKVRIVRVWFWPLG
ncbi:hypothetical protein D6777_02000 [Candidatus Woesearchaeota archaeon]|nr:MAG: hypothetical protein D6777_02000 [Candidatus Woesearchaeota archaeon]